MSSIRGLGDVRGVQRLLWLLAGTVIVPTILLSLYGVTAVRTQQDRLVEQVRRQQDERLRWAARELFAEVSALDAAVRARAGACATTGPCAMGLAGVGATEVRASDDPLSADLPALDLPPGNADTVWFSPADGSAPVGVYVDGARRVAWRPDPERLRATLDDRAADRFGRPDVRFALEGPRPGPATPIEEMAARWTEHAPPELVLERPFALWRLALAYPDADPAAEILAPTRWLYPAGLVALVGLVVVGAGITLSSASREIRLSRLQTDFVSNVSHELRTPLTSIRMFVETLQSGRLRDPAKIGECLDLLGRETDRLSRMIERVLDLTRMEAGRRTYEFEDVSVRELVDGALQALRSHTLLDDVDVASVAVDLPGHLPLLRVDRDAIVEALLNLLQNAVRYTPSPRRIRVSAEPRGAWVGVSVEDNGPGIEPRHRRRIFEKFYQADTLLSSTTRSRGSGLGLSIVRAVVRGHGGRVELRTTLGAGSRFTVWLPAARETG